MNPLHEPVEKFTRILGIDIMQDRLDNVIAKLGKSPEITKGGWCRIRWEVLLFD
jgi:hypothetical protein